MTDTDPRQITGDLRYGIKWDPPIGGHELRFPYRSPEHAEAEALAAKVNAPTLFADRSYEVVREDAEKEPDA